MSCPICCWNTCRAAPVDTSAIPTVLPPTYLRTALPRDPTCLVQNLELPPGFLVPRNLLWDVVLHARESFLPFHLSCPDLSACSTLQHHDHSEGCPSGNSEQLTWRGHHHSLLTVLCGLAWFYKHNTHIMKSHTANWSFPSDPSQPALGWWNLLRASQECKVWGC